MVELSVVVPTRGRPGRLGPSLRSLARQLPAGGTVEVLVVDDGSQHDVGPLVAASLPVARLIRQEHAGPGVARNRGAQAAAGRILLFLDDDVVAADGLISAHLAAHAASGGIVGLGRLELAPLLTAGPLGGTMRQWWREHYSRLAAGSGRPTYMDCYSGNLSVARDAFRACGGFGEDLAHSEDVELGFRLQELGLRFVYLPLARGYQRFDKGFGAYVAEARASGRAGLLLLHRHPAMLSTMPIGAYSQARPVERALRRVALAAPRAAFTAMTALDPVLGRSRWHRGWYGFVRRAAYWCGVKSVVESRETWQRLTSGTAIIAYHGFGERGEPPSAWVLPLQQLEAQLAWLRRQGYSFIGLDEYLAHRRQHRLPPPRAVVVTIDDGYADLPQALPILRRSGVPATVFLVSRQVGGTNTWDRRGAQTGRPLLDWDEIRELDRNGMEFGAHSRNHRRLADLSASDMDDEIGGSREDLEHELGHPVTAFAYPFGEVTPEITAAVGRAGFTAGLASRPAVNAAAQPDLQLQRIVVRGTDSLLKFALVLQTGDARWMRRFAIRRWLDRLR